jgi:hypothetical protein
MNRVLQSAFSLVIGLIACWAAASTAQATTFDVGEIHVPGLVGLSSGQGGSGAPGFVDFPADEYDFAVDNGATLTATFGILLVVPLQSPSDHIDLSLYESDSSGMHLLIAATGADQAELIFDVAPGHSYAFLVADGFVNNPPEVGGYGGLLKFAVAPTPLPGTLPLFASALGGLGFLAVRHQKTGPARP